MRSLIPLYTITLVVVLCLDGLWLWTAFPFYQRELGSMLASQLRYGPIALFYLLYSTAIVGLTVLPSASCKEAAIRGTLLGMAAYGTYDLTNRATLENFSLTLACADLAWGTFLTLSASSVSMLWKLNRKAGA